MVTATERKREREYGEHGMKEVRWRKKKSFSDEKKGKRNERRKSAPRNQWVFLSVAERIRTKKRNIFIVSDHVLLLTQWWQSGNNEIQFAFVVVVGGVGGVNEMNGDAELKMETDANDAIQNAVQELIETK